MTLSFQGLRKTATTDANGDTIMQGSQDIAGEGRAGLVGRYARGELLRGGAVTHPDDEVECAAAKAVST